MGTFYEFLKQDDEPALALPSPKQSASVFSISSLVSIGVAQIATAIPLIPKGDADRFGQEMASLLTSDDFLKGLSDSIQQPNEGETEDEFVLRCRQSLLGLIDQKLGSK